MRLTPWFGSKFYGHADGDRGAVSTHDLRVPIADAGDRSARRASQGVENKMDILRIVFLCRLDILCSVDYVICRNGTGVLVRR